MTRRGALIATLLLAAGELTRADQNLTVTGSAWKPRPSRLIYAFTDAEVGTGFSELEIRLPGQTLTFTAAEIQRELAHVHRPTTWGEHVYFTVNGRRLEVCEDCGQTFWGKS
jgi:hypothetical protein